MTFVFYGCTLSRVSDDFEYIDYSYASLYEGLRETISMKIFKNGNIYICNDYYYPNEKYFYNFNLDNAQLDSISQMTKIIINNKPDSIIYSNGCDQCRAFNFIIKSKDKTIKTHYFGDSFFDKKNYSLFHFAAFLNKIAEQNKKSADQFFVFESLTKLLPRLTPPPIDSVSPP
jgi:hypothetical protein